MPATRPLRPPILVWVLAFSIPAALAGQDVPPTSDEPAGPPAPEASPAPADARPKITYSDGQTNFEFAGGSLSISNRAQFRFTEELPDDDLRLPGTEAGGDPKGSFRIRRAKTELSGWVWRKELTYELQLSWAGAEAGASTTEPLEDFILTWDASRKKTFQITVGQFKVPLGRQEMTSSNRLQFVDRDILSFEFTRGRDIGVQLQGLVAGGRLEYRAGVFNGNPASRLGNDNDRYQYNARVVLQPWGDVRYSESDFESKDKPLLAVGAQFENNDLRGVTNATDFNTTILGADAVFKYRGFSLFAEYFDRRRKPETGESFDSNGFHAQAGYFVKRNVLEVAARYAGFDPSSLIAENDLSEKGLGLNYYLNKHNLKLQGDLRSLKDESRGRTNKEVRLQVQVRF
jgi:phosphate-selective porin OprO and OprP